MTDIKEVNISSQIVIKLGLRLTDKKLNADISPDARIFEYPQIKNVFIMENDLYGNVMPKDSCFLAFYGTHGLIGKHMRVETLVNASVEDVKNMVEADIEG